MNYMRSLLGKSSLLLTISIASGACGNAFAANGAGEVLQQLEKTDKTYQFKKEAAPVIEKEDKKPDTERQQAGKRIFVKKFRLTGNTLISEKELLSGVNLGSGKILALEEIIGVADRVTAKYRDKGFLIVNAYVPSQSIFDGATIIKNDKGYYTVNAFGTVLIKVVEGKVGDISVTGNKSYSSSFIADHIENVRNDPSLKMETLEKELLILNEYPSLAVRTTLKAGKKAGTTDVIATVSDKFPLFGTVSYDNYGVKSTSKNRLSALLNVGNSITDGDLIRVNGVIGLDGLDMNRLLYGRAEYIIPVGTVGTQVGAYYSNTVYNAAGIDSLALLELKGKAHVTGIYATHPIMKKFDRTLNLRFGGEYVSLHDDILGNIQNKDEIRKLTAGISHESTDRFSGRNYISLGYSGGLGGFLGGTKSGETYPGPSHSGADNTFNKITLDAMRIQKLPGYNHLIAKGSIQYSPDRLFSAERMQLGGINSVRGFNPATLSGDSGYFTSLELAASPFSPDAQLFTQKVGDTIKFALFTEHGGVTNTNPRPAEITSSNLSCIGTGVRVYGMYGDNNVSFKLDWALPGTHGSYGGFRLSDSQVYVQAMVSF